MAFHATNLSVHAVPKCNSVSWFYKVGLSGFESIRVGLGGCDAPGAVAHVLHRPAVPALPTKLPNRTSGLKI